MSSDSEKTSDAMPGGCQQCDKRETVQVRRQRSRNKKVKQKQKQKQINRKRELTEFKRPRSHRPKHCVDAEDTAKCMITYKKRLKREKGRRKADFMMTLDVSKMNVDTALEDFDAVYAEFLEEEGLTEEEFDSGNFFTQADQNMDSIENDMDIVEDDMEDLGEEDGGNHLAYKPNRNLKRTLSKGKQLRNKKRNRTKSRNKSNVLQRCKGKPGAASCSQKSRKTRKRWERKNKSRLRRRASAIVVAQRWLFK